MSPLKTLEPTLLCFFIITILVFTVQSAPPRNSDRDEYLAVHNKARAAVKVGPLKWNSTLTTYARNYARRRARDCAMQHSGGPYGENLASGSWRMSGTEASKLWAAEKPHYNYATNKCRGGAQCGHYTQMVWRNTRRVGCARAICRNGWSFVVCSYDPPGNYYGERPY